MKNRKGFTLIEILVVVLIIGILAAIALPQYQKAVMKADLHRGVNLVESLYQAQQAYFLAHGEFATDIDDLDVLIPKNESCVKTQDTDVSYYQCDYGRIGFFDNISNAQFQNKPYIENVSRADVAYIHTLKDFDNWVSFKADTRYCFARSYNEITQEVCQNIGGVYFGVVGTNWIIYEIK